MNIIISFVQKPFNMAPKTRQKSVIQFNFCLTTEKMFFVSDLHKKRNMEQKVSKRIKKLDYMVETRKLRKFIEKNISISQFKNKKPKVSQKRSLW